jgi:3-oxoacyl-[acyl-carrier-protein] synthase III
MAILRAPTSAPSGTPPGATRTAAILGVAAYVPDEIITNAQLEALVETSDAWILERTGIRERRKVASGMTTSIMAAEAGRRAMAAAGVDSVDALIVATVSPDTPLPSTACLVQRRLGLDGIPAFDIAAACAGFVYGVTIARGLIVASGMRRVLVIAGDALTSLIDYKDRSTCVLFGDGAGAAVLGVSDDGGIEGVQWGADGGEADLIYYGPKAGEEDGENGLRMYGKGTFRLGVERMAEAAREVCAEAGWALSDVDLLVPHQANLRIIEAVAKRLDMPLDRVVINIDRYGNTSGASIPIALAEAVETGRIRQGDRIVCIAFGSGVVWGGIALRWIAPTQ